ncbi:hypothetical protein B0J13DRAFT_453946 [Dactylonectria estremocensis]|uniref:Uncharacterized protein n=1 Tax=Dactylonectria estremocensis TaxID=1079267 RepID=A0A9P9DWG8_9HYPO|nr:hypothetical protein B0J13DRAFT_453946 [Dactylonectria estremocensis]
MIDDGAHKKWKSSSLEASMIDRLGDNSQSLKDIIEDIGTIISDVEKGLECFSGLDKERFKDERLKDTVRRVRDRMNIVFDKSKFEKWTSDLRDSNSDLKLFREQMGELNKPITRTRRGKNYAIAQRLHKYTFKNYTDTRMASQALHEALCTAWSTPDSAHFRHSVRLFLETKCRDEVQLDLVISCLEHKMKQVQNQTASYNARLASSLALANMMTVHVKSKALVILGPGFITTSLDSNNSRQKRRRVVRFEDDSDKETEIQSTLSSTSLEAALDLQRTQHFCSELVPKILHGLPEAPSSNPCKRRNHTSACLGYLDTWTRDEYRHSFFPCREGVCNPSLCKGDIKPEGLTRMDEMLAKPRSDELSVPEQLRLALRLVSAVLRFNSTSWLGECWGLQDLYFFEQDSDLAASLKTLHIKADWSKSPAGELMDVDSAGDLRFFEEAKLVHGIYNATVYNLGVALLSIGRWVRVDPNDVLNVRRMASQPCPLGPKYQEMTQKVLDCDFGCGKDLSKTPLQHAIFEGIMLELESMISSLSIR